MGQQLQPENEAIPAVSAWRKLAVFVALSLLFVALGTIPSIRMHLQPDVLDKTVEGLGWKGALLLFGLGAFSPLLLLPRWPIAVVSGLVYGVFWGTCLANTASLAGACLQYALARSTLSHLAERLLAKNRWRHVLESRRHMFCILFLFRAFPLSNFVATNLLCGTLKIPAWTYLAASALGMIPSTILYAAWGKLTIKPSWGFGALIAAALLFLTIGTLFARRFLLRAEKNVGERND
jgi:uncharacterized membrane protein YdjX (TVP38/TMEM64 family)